MSATKPRPFRFGTGAFHHIQSRTQFINLARKIEDMGYAIYLIPDHFVDAISPIGALMAVADATSLRIGSYVLDNDFRHPAVVAREAASLDLLSEGRFELGLGAGWVESDYTQTGIPFDAPGVRVSRLTESVQIIKGLFADGPFTFSGKHYTITNLEAWPKPVQRPHPPIVIGASSQRMLSMAAREANIISLFVPSPGSQPQIAEGSSAAVTQRIEWVRKAAADRFDELEFNILILHLRITDNRKAGVEELAKNTGLTSEQVLDNVHILVGTVDQIVEDLQMRREQFGISYITAREQVRDELAPVVARLAGT
jgi:probable F420-dependent oxidoreductase